MKSHISLFLLTLALAASSTLTLTAHASACSNSTIQGIPFSSGIARSRMIRSGLNCLAPGNKIHQVATDPGLATTAEGERVRTPQE